MEHFLCPGSRRFRNSTFKLYDLHAPYSYLFLAMNSGKFEIAIWLQTFFLREFEAINSGQSGMFHWPIL